MLQVAAPKEIYDRPTTAEVADFIGRCSFLPATVTEQTDDGRITVELAGGGALTVTSHAAWPAGQRVSVGIRAERMTVVPPRTDVTPASLNAIPAELKKVSYVGARYEYEVIAGDELVFAESPAEVTERNVWLVVPQDAAYVFADRPATTTMALAEVDT